MKFKLHPLRETVSWKEAYAEGVEIGKNDAKKEVIKKLLAKGMSLKQISELMDMSVEEVQRLAEDHPH